LKILRLTTVLFCLSLLALVGGPNLQAADGERRLLYVAVPGIRNYLEWGGAGILVYDVENDHRLVKRIPSFEVKPDKAPEAIKGICASAKTGRVYLSTPTRLLCLDLTTEKPVWEKAFEGGCDRMSMSPDGKIIYLPSFEGPHWNVVNAVTGDLITRVETKSGSHNTVYGGDGARAYLAGLRSPLLSVADTQTHKVVHTIGPFSASIRPFTVNASQTLCYVNVNDLLGFEIGDLKTGKMLHRVEVTGYQKGLVKRHGCPSHGIGLTPDEKEIWLSDAANSTVHVFDNTSMPPKQVASLKVRDQPGWVTFSIDGRYAYPSTGEVFDTQTRQQVTALSDENGKPVQSEKLLEIVFAGGKPVRAGDQFGIGRKRVME
jgi:outer membrane protein assembly factor BamB